MYSIPQTLEIIKEWPISERLNAIKVLKDSIEAEYDLMKSNESVFQKKAPSDDTDKKKEIVNPWNRATLNLTRQAQIMREDPELAAKLKAEAV